MNPIIIEGAGNVFAVLTEDGLGGRPGAEVARELCRELRLDGLLEIRPGRAGAHVRMVIWNADGTRPEACGNGLRCAALFARETGLAGTDSVRVETDCGQRTVALLRSAAGDVEQARANLGPARIVALDLALELEDGRSVAATQVDVGNPHCVIFTEDADLSALDTLGPWLVGHPHFSAGANVEFARISDDGLAAEARVFERGVGETAACGTGAVAIAAAAEATGRGRLPFDVFLPGGALRVERDEIDGAALLTGPVSRVSVPLPHPAD